MSPLMCTKDRNEQIERGFHYAEFACCIPAYELTDCEPFLKYS